MSLPLLLLAGLARPQAPASRPALPAPAGFGSALARDPASPDGFYLLTDRGPNFDVPGGGAKGFKDPAYVPKIGRFRLAEEGLKLVATIELKSATGKPLSGRPRSDERAVDRDGNPLPEDPDGVDPEGLVVLPDGTFWVSEEYGPSILHFDAQGKLLAWSQTLPRVLRRRKSNHGLEGLTLTPDGKTLVAVMQSPLENPDKDSRKGSRAVRILALDLATGRTRQHVYLLEDPDHSISEIVALSSTSFLVLERDSKVPFARTDPSKHKAVWRADLADATDVSDPQDADAGKLFDGKTLEQLRDGALAKAAIRTAKKTLVLDLLAAGYPHEKPEGMCLVGDDSIAIADDDDFGIEGDGKGGFRPKLLADGTPERCEIRFFRIR